MIRCGIVNRPSRVRIAYPAPFYPKAAALSHHKSRASRQPASQGRALFLLLLVSALVALVWRADDMRSAGFHAPIPEESQVVETESPLLCVHTLLENEVEAAKIIRSLELTRELGAATIVQFFPWAYAEPAQGRYDWRRFDSIIRQARLQGLGVIARLGLTPDWARPPDTPLTALPDSAFNHFADYAAAFSERYADALDHIMIWNEPNLSAEWGFQAAEPARYARLLREAYTRVKAANPRAVVLAGALAPTLETSGSPAGLNDLDFLRAMYQHGASQHFDALAVHTYGFRAAPEAEPGSERLNFRRVELMREIMLAHGDGDKPVYITESGWNDHPRWIYGVRPSQRAAYSVRALQYAAAHWDWLRALCVWALRYPRDTRGHPDGFTLMTADFQPKPIYYELQAFARGWQQTDALWLPPPMEV